MDFTPQERVKHQTNATRESKTQLSLIMQSNSEKKNTLTTLKKKKDIYTGKKKFKLIHYKKWSQKNIVKLCKSMQYVQSLCKHVTIFLMIVSLKNPVPFRYFSFLFVCLFQSYLMVFKNLQSLRIFAVIYSLDSSLLPSGILLLSSQRSLSFLPRKYFP